MLAALTCLSYCSAPALSRRTVTVIPEDVRPGYTVRRLRPSPQHTAYTLAHTPVAQYFAVLEDGLVMTTADLRPLVNLPVNLGVLEETPNTTSSHTLHMYVLDRADMIKFERPLYEGAKIRENLPVGSHVLDIGPLIASGIGAGGPLKYSVVGGNDHGAFSVYHNDSGAYLLTARVLDREHRSQYKLNIQASDNKGIDRANTHVLINVEDVNDNSPVFDKRLYRFSLSKVNGTEWKRFSKIGRVHATDADGDRVAYRLKDSSHIVIIVPQTGEILLTGDPSLNTEYEVSVESHDLRTPSRVSKPSKVYLEFNEEEMSNVIHREKRRVTRAVRPTKRIEFTEAEGETEGRIVFQLEKETERETFKIRDENPWVTVEPNGAVRVKKKWDYEELGPEKTIDFWVVITNAGVGGK
ncbi:hypothetical protein O3M35_005432 [Rhynocoris fuscipes]|uniref:Cadherin domain-containing protein n=1 Tax=Rhynocoris fuscipes TaxID=488301 RepID=A0AAW1DJK2_9HEMI